jgi:hypothetical protein
MCEFCFDKGETDHPDGQAEEVLLRESGSPCFIPQVCTGTELCLGVPVSVPVFYKIVGTGMFSITPMNRIQQVDVAKKSGQIFLNFYLKVPLRNNTH